VKVNIISRKTRKILRVKPSAVEEKERPEEKGKKGEKSVLISFNCVEGKGKKKGKTQVSLVLRGIGLSPQKEKKKKKKEGGGKNEKKKKRGKKSPKR